jgi:hypothetical protein
MIKSRRRWAGHATHMGDMRNAYSSLILKPEWKRQLRRLWHIWEDNIRMDLREIGWEGTDCIHLAQDGDHWWALVNTVTNVWTPQKVGNFFTR